MDNSIAIAKAIRELECDDEVKKALGNLFIKESGNTVPVTADDYKSIIVFHADRKGGTE